MPSMVSTSPPSHSTPRTRHESTGWPSSSTAQAPHSPSSQPCLVPHGPGLPAALREASLRGERDFGRFAVDGDGEMEVLRASHGVRGGWQARITRPGLPTCSLTRCWRRAAGVVGFGQAGLTERSSSRLPRKRARGQRTRPGVFSARPSGFVRLRGRRTPCLNPIVLGDDVPDRRRGQARPSSKCNKCWIFPLVQQTQHVRRASVRSCSGSGLPTCGAPASDARPRRSSVPALAEVEESSLPLK